MSGCDGCDDCSCEAPAWASETRSELDAGLHMDRSPCAACALTSPLGPWIQVARLVVADTPVSQPRPRVYATHTVSDSPRSRRWKYQVARAVSNARIGAIGGAVRVDLVFSMPRPQRLKRKDSPLGPIAHVAKPDVDNLAKAVLDGLYPVIADDAYVVALTAAKVYQARDACVGCLITISKLSGGDDETIR